MLFQFKIILILNSIVTEKKNLGDRNCMHLIVWLKASNFTVTSRYFLTTSTNSKKAAVKRVLIRQRTVYWQNC